MNSHAHPALASVGAWLFRFVAGLRLDDGTLDQPSDGYAKSNAPSSLCCQECGASSFFACSIEGHGRGLHRGNDLAAWIIRLS